MNSTFKDKKTLIVFQSWRPLELGLSYPIKLSLEKYGMKVDCLDICNPPPYKVKFYDKYLNIFKRVFLKDTYHYYQVEKAFFNKFYLKRLKQNKENYDYILVIRPDEYTSLFTKELKKKGKKVCGYFWDGIHENWIRDIEKIKNDFDALFSFENRDVLKYKTLNLKFCTNFYMENLIDEYSKNCSRNKKIIYIGSIAGKEGYRRDKLIHEKFPNNYLKDSEIIIYYDEGYILKEDEIKDSFINYTNKKFPYIEMLNRVKDAEVFLDFCMPHHKGLSFRVFESLFLEKKIIMDNPEVVNYDFYTPENILIAHYSSDKNIENKIKEFMSIPYKKVPEEIKKKYSLENWFKYIFDIDGHIPITYGK